MSALLEKFWQDVTAQYYFEILKNLISKKSIFAQRVGLEEVASYLAEIFEHSGAEVIVDDSYTAPFLIAKFKSPVPQAKNIIFYNHYDTVPADGDQIWTEEPFTLVVRDGYMYGRGVEDDKGHITARLTAVRKYLQEFGDLPVNVTFILEGAEESASVDLEKYLAKYRDIILPADLLVWEQGSKNALNQLEITGGNKGIVTFDVTVDSAHVDLHSKYGGVVESASWYLIQALTSMRTADGRILIDGIYEAVQEPSEREMNLVETYALENHKDLVTRHGLKLPLHQEERYQFLKTYYFEPALNIEGIWSGYQGQGVKTILPAQAFAKMEMRLVPGLSPAFVLEKIKEHLIKHGFDQVQVTYTLGEESYRSDMSSGAILGLIDIAKKYYPAGVSVLPTSAGTGPMHKVFEALGVPMAAFGISNPNSRGHGGDENVSLEDYYTHILLVKELIQSYDQSYYSTGQH